MISDKPSKSCDLFYGGVLGERFIQGFSTSTGAFLCILFVQKYYLNIMETNHVSLDINALYQVAFCCSSLVVDGIATLHYFTWELRARYANAMTSIVTIVIPINFHML